MSLRWFCATTTFRASRCRSPAAWGRCCSISSSASFVFSKSRGALSRAIEFLPSDDEIAERRTKGIPLTSPERAVLLAYSKMWLFDELLASDLPEDPWVGTALARYFPSVLKEKFGSYIERHPLKREIVATHVLNSMVNRVGSTFVHRLMETTGVDAVSNRSRLSADTRNIRAGAGLASDRGARQRRARRAAIADGDRARAPHRACDQHGSCVRAGLPSRWLERSSDLRRRQPHCCSSLLRRRTALRGVHRSRNTSRRWWLKVFRRRSRWRWRHRTRRLQRSISPRSAESSKQPLPVVANTYFSIGEVLGLARLRTQVSALLVGRLLAGHGQERVG